MFIIIVTAIAFLLHLLLKVLQRYNVRIIFEMEQQNTPESRHSHVSRDAQETSSDAAPESFVTNADNINFLSNLQILKILDYLPIGTLLNETSLISRRFKLLRDTLLFTRKSLTLQMSTPSSISTFSSYNYTPTTHLHSTLHVSPVHFNPDPLILTLPNLTSLTITQLGVSKIAFCHVALILDQNTIKRQLVELKLTIGYQERDSSLFDLISRINALHGLRNLTLETFQKILSKTQNSLDLPILSQLEHFTINSPDPAEIFYDSLLLYANLNSELKSLQILNEIEKPERFLEFDDNFADKFKHLNISNNYSWPIFNQFCGKFKHLTELSLALNPVSFSASTQYLSRLENCTTLHIYFNPDLAVHSDLFQHTNQLPNITKIALYFWTESHCEYLNIFEWENIFSNVQLFKIWFAACNNCQHRWISVWDQNGQWKKRECWELQTKNLRDRFERLGRRTQFVESFAE